MIKRLIFILLVCAVSAQGGTFGNTSWTGTSQLNIEDACLGGWWDCDSNGYADTMHVRVLFTGADKKCHAAIYRDSSGTYVMVDTSEVLTVSNSVSEQDLAFEMQQLNALVKDTRYALVVAAENDGGVDIGRAYYHTPSTNDTLWKRTSGAIFGVWPSTLTNFSVWIANYSVEIYCVYTASEATKPQVIIINND